jgi:hypothetical protein
MARQRSFQKSLRGAERFAFSLTVKAVWEKFPRRSQGSKKVISLLCKSLAPTSGIVDTVYSTTRVIYLP